jgi:hypothetical protein
MGNGRLLVLWPCNTLNRAEQGRKDAFLPGDSVPRQRAAETISDVRQNGLLPDLSTRDVGAPALRESKASMVV